jgi:hypothetical protein
MLSFSVWSSKSFVATRRQYPIHGSRKGKYLKDEIYRINGVAANNRQQP